MDDTQRDASDDAPSAVRQVDETSGLVPVPVEAPASAASNGGGTSHIEDRVIERARETAERLKPVAIAAEEMTARALDLSAKGLAKAAAYLEQRRQARRAQTPPGSGAESASPESVIPESASPDL